MNDSPLTGAVESSSDATPEASRAPLIYADAVARLAEIGDAHGCEASSAAAFEHGRLAVLNELGYVNGELS